VVPNHALYQAKLRPAALFGTISTHPDRLHFTILKALPLQFQLPGSRAIVKVEAMISRFALLTACLLAVPLSVFGQAAVSTSTNPQASATPQVSPAPSMEGPAPRIPAIDELDQAFKQSSLGKAADEARLHAQWRELSNRIINDPDLVAARTKADKMKTDLEKRQQLRLYYNMFYDRMRTQAASPELKNYIDTRKNEHLWSTAQNRVRPSPSPAATPKPKPKVEATVPEPPLPQ
jgi:hypothetical protein